MGKGKMVEIDAASILSTLVRLAEEQKRIDGLPFEVQQCLKVPEDFPTNYKYASRQVYEHFMQTTDEGWRRFDEDKVRMENDILQSKNCDVAYVL